jgi:hypothetical protein
MIYTAETTCSEKRILCKRQDQRNLGVHSQRSIVPHGCQPLMQNSYFQPIQAAVTNSAHSTKLQNAKRVEAIESHGAAIIEWSKYKSPPFTAAPRLKRDCHGPIATPYYLLDAQGIHLEQITLPKKEQKNSLN